LWCDVCGFHNTSSYGYGFENTIIDAVTTKKKFNGKVLLAEQVTDSYLSGLNALGGLYAKLESSENILKKK
jgi:hypothetical protein